MITLDKWNITRTETNKTFILKNGQFMKIIFSYKNSDRDWHMSMVVANSKRQCNDCLRKTEFSPKILYGKKTGNKTGLEPMVIALNSLLEFEKTINNCGIIIQAASEKLHKIYSRLEKYGYEVKIKNPKYNNGRVKQYLYKYIINYPDFLQLEEE